MHSPARAVLIASVMVLACTGDATTALPEVGGSGPVIPGGGEGSSNRQNG